MGKKRPPYRKIKKLEQYDHKIADRFYAETGESMFNDEAGRWESRIPYGKYEGRILKTEEHPTFDKTLAGEKEAGMQFYKKFGKLYSFPEDPGLLYKPYTPMKHKSLPSRKASDPMPKYFLGGPMFDMNSPTNQTLQNASPLIGMTGQLMGGGNSVGGGMLSGAAAGASLGLPGMIGGGIIGAVGSLFNKKKEEERKQRERENRKIAMRQSRLSSDQSRLGTFPSEGVEAANYFAADGGFIMPDYEAEGGEVLEDPGQNAQAFTGVLEGLSSDMQKLNGLPHSQGGMEMSGGEFMYTKRWKGTPQLIEDLYNTTGIKFKRDTYAGLAETIGRKKGQVEQKLDSYDPASLNTANMMLERLEEGLELVKAEQEYRKMDKEYAA